MTMDLKYSDTCYIVKNFLTIEQCNSLITEYEKRKNESHTERSTHAFLDKNLEIAFRVVWLKPNTKNFDLIHNKTEQFINEWIDYLHSLNCFFPKYLKRNLKYSHRYRILKYKKGDYIHPHSDWDNFTHASVTFNLNDDYEGGEFVFFNGKHVVKLGKGDAIIFPADCFWVHEVKPILSGERYSINSFICSLPYKIRESMLDHAHIMTSSSILKNEYYYPSCEEFGMKNNFKYQ